LRPGLFSERPKTSDHAGRYDFPASFKSARRPSPDAYALNGWRFIGLGFLMAYQEGLLPGGFAWPAGLGDIAMAATAPWVAARVSADDRFRFGNGFLIWNLFGIADFIDAVLLGTLYNWPGFASLNTGLMQHLPFALIPCFFVPLVAIAHFILLAQRRAPQTEPK
jgi:hypothetical protein